MILPSFLLQLLNKPSSLLIGKNNDEQINMNNKTLCPITIVLHAK